MKGLVLEGGGAKGSYQIGAYKALNEEGHTFGYIVGTSIGSLNGAMIAQGDVDEAETIWRNIKFSTVVDVDDEKMMSLYDWDISNFSLERLQVKFSLVSKIFKNKGFDITPLKELLDTYIDEDKVRNSSMKFGLVTVGISDVKPLEIFIDDMEKGSLKNYLLASSYLPVFKQEPIEGKYYLDGGFYDNIPYKMIDDKCEEIFIIGLYDNKKIEAFSDTEKYKYIKPREELCDIFHFTEESANYNISLGYYDARKFLENLLGDKYYIRPMAEKESLEILISAGERMKGSLNNIKSFLELDLNIYCDHAGIQRSLNYSEIMALFLDRIADDIGLERFKIYSLKELAIEINNSELFYEKVLMVDKKFEHYLIKELCK